MALSGLLGLLACLQAVALNPIVIKGNKLYDSVTKKRFVVKGLDYAPDFYANPALNGTAENTPYGTDLIADERQHFWKWDLPLLAELKVNAIRVYDVDPQKLHGRFMNAAEDLGIYVIVSATKSTGEGVLRADLPSPACYTTPMVVSARKIAAQFAQFNNTLGLVVANEIGNAVDVDGNGTLVHGWRSLPCVKALARDLRSYMHGCSCHQRILPLLYAGTDFNDMEPPPPTPLTTAPTPAFTESPTSSDLKPANKTGADTVIGKSGRVLMSRGVRNEATRVALDDALGGDKHKLGKAGRVLLDEVAPSSPPVGASPAPSLTPSSPPRPPTPLRPRMLVSDYLTCGDRAAALDMYGVNVYTWCSSTATPDEGSTFGAMTNDYSGSSIPLVLSEFGCNQGNFQSEYPFNSGQRTWRQIPSLLGPSMNGVWSGGFAYEYSMRDNGFGLVLLPGYQDGQASIVKLDSFTYLSRHYTNFAIAPEFGEWNEQDLCTWQPNMEGKSQAACPNAEDAQRLLDYSGIDDMENWSSALPALDESGAYVPCNNGDDLFAREHNECMLGGHMDCPCDTVPSSQWCNVSFAPTTPDPVIAGLFDGLCSLLGQFGGDHSDICWREISNQGLYAECSLEQKANYLLHTWTDDVQAGKECCSSLMWDDTCETVDCPFGVCVCPELREMALGPVVNESDLAAGVFPNVTTCHVSWNEDTSRSEMQHFFEVQCGLLHDHASGNLTDICLSLGQHGRYEDCLDIDKANFVAQAWFEFKEEKECCADAGQTGVCRHQCPRGVCPCDRIKTNKNCHVRWDEGTEESEKQAFFGRMCTLLNRFGDNTTIGCETIDVGGMYAECDSEAKANFLLNQWMKFKGEHECCESLSYSTRCTSICPEGKCVCDEIIANRDCHVDWTMETSTEQITRLFEQQCSLFVGFAPDDLQACDQIGTGGRYEFCSDTEKANYILDIWRVWVKDGQECCALLAKYGYCERNIQHIIPTPKSGGGGSVVIPDGGGGYIPGESPRAENAGTGRPGAAIVWCLLGIMTLFPTL